MTRKSISIVRCLYIAFSEPVVIYVNSRSFLAGGYPYMTRDRRLDDSISSLGSIFPL